MLQFLLKGLRTGAVIAGLEDYRRLSLQRLQIEAATLYVRGVKFARLSTIGLMRMGLVIALLGVGVLLIHVGLFVLIPGTVKVKALIGVLLGLAYGAVGIAVLRAAMNEKSWMTQSGVDGMLDEAVRPSTRV